VDSAARSAETVNASHTAGKMSRQPRQRQRYFVSFASRDIGERQGLDATFGDGGHCDRNVSDALCRGWCKRCTGEDRLEAN
jgi:hypothetical protein